VQAIAVAVATPLPASGKNGVIPLGRMRKAHKQLDEVIDAYAQFRATH